MTNMATKIRETDVNRETADKTKKLEDRFRYLARVLSGRKRQQGDSADETKPKGTCGLPKTADRTA